MIFFKATIYMILDIALSTLIDNILRNFPGLFKINLKIGSKIEEIIVIFDLDSYDTVVRGVMKDAEVIAIVGDKATFKYSSFTIFNNEEIEIWATVNSTIELPISAMK
jgi:hypothetical protein